MPLHPVETYLKDLAEIHRTGGGVGEESSGLPGTPARWDWMEAQTWEEVRDCFGLVRLLGLLTR
jgi:hypothetical protein